MRNKYSWFGPLLFVTTFHIGYSLLSVMEIQWMPLTVTWIIVLAYRIYRIEKKHKIFSLKEIDDKAFYNSETTVELNSEHYESLIERVRELDNKA